MALWYKEYNISDGEDLGKGTMMETLDMEITEIGDDFLVGRMPIGPKTIQPARLLHGGASVALAETLGSVASYMIIDPEKYICVGQSIQANHLRPGIKGFVNARTKVIRIGKTSHVWDIDLTNDEGKLICVCRLTMAILPKTS